MHWAVYLVFGLLNVRQPLLDCPDYSMLASLIDPLYHIFILSVLFLLTVRYTIRPSTMQFIHSLIHPPAIQLSVHQPICSFTRPLTHPSIHLTLYLYSSIHVSILLSLHHLSSLSSTHSFINLISHPSILLIHPLIQDILCAMNQSYRHKTCT